MKADKKLNVYRAIALSDRIKAGLMLIVMAQVFCTSAQAGLVGVEWNGSFWGIEQDSSGLSTLELGRVGSGGVISGFNSMAMGSDGTLYTILTRNLPIDDAALYSIDLETGAGTLLQQFTMPPEPSPFTSARITALAFNDQDGLLYFVDTTVADIFNTPRISDLYSLDPVTGAYSLIGSLELGVATAMAFDSNGTLFAWLVDSSGLGFGAGLSTVDIATGIATDVNFAVAGNASDVQTLAFDSSGNLFGANEFLYEIDLQTGALSNQQLIFDGADFRGMEFISVPVPGAFVLFVSAGVFVRVLSKRY